MTVLRVASAALLFACAPASAPASPATVYAELVEAGCLAPSADGYQSVVDEHATPGEPGWMACLFLEGGTVAGCAVPCK